MQIKNPSISFGASAAHDIFFKFELCVGVKKHADRNFLIYDEMRLETNFDIEINQEVLFANFNSLSVFPSGEEAHRRTKPIYSIIDFTSEQYEDFWDYMDIRMEKWLGFFNNEIFVAGVPLPYWKLAFTTDLNFYPGVMHVIMNLYYNM